MKIHNVSEIHSQTGLPTSLAAAGESDRVHLNQTQQALSLLTPKELEFLTFLTSIGVGIAALAPLKTGSKKEFNWTANGDKRPSLTRLKSYRRGYAIVAATDGPLNVIDVDPRNGGLETFERLEEFLPLVVAKVATPGDGWHYYVKSIGAPTTKFGGIDYLGNAFQVFAPGTSRPKYQNKGYELVEFNQFDPSANDDRRFYDRLVLLKREDLATRATYLDSKVSHVNALKKSRKGAGVGSQLGQLYGPYGYIQMGMSRMMAAPVGQRHNRLWIESFMLGHFNLDDSTWLGRVTDALVSACERSGFANEHRSTMYQTISDGFIAGQIDQLDGEEV
jgi:hypothetical protein